MEMTSNRIKNQERNPHDLQVEGNPGTLNLPLTVDKIYVL